MMKFINPADGSDVAEADFHTHGRTRQNTSPLKLEIAWTSSAPSSQRLGGIPSMESRW